MENIEKPEEQKIILLKGEKGRQTSVVLVSVKFFRKWGQDSMGVVSNYVGVLKIPQYPLSLWNIENAYHGLGLLLSRPR